MKRLMSVWFVLAVLLSACAGSPSTGTPSAAPTAGTATLTVLTHDSFAISEKLVTDFEQQNNVKVTFIKGGDAGSALNRVILSKGSPLADVFYGVDNTFLSRALEESVFEPYDAPALANIPVDFRLDSANGALPVDYGDVCINYDKAYFAENNLPVPASFNDLLQPEYNGLLVVQNPATSSPGLAFLLATIAAYPDTWQGYWAALRDNGVVVVNDWETAYYTNFSASSGKGPQPMVVSYASSPAAEVIFASTPLDQAPTASITAPGMCFRQVEFAGILAGTPNRALAEKFIDFLLSKEFQEDVPLQMFVYPVLTGAALPDAFTRWSQSPESVAALDPQQIAANRAAWIQSWTETVLR